MRNISVNLFWHWITGSGDVKRYFISYLHLWWPIRLAERNHFFFLVDSAVGEHFCEIVLIWTSIFKEKNTDIRRSIGAFHSGELKVYRQTITIANLAT